MSSKLICGLAGALLWASCTQPNMAGPSSGGTGASGPQPAGTGGISAAAGDASIAAGVGAAGGSTGGGGAAGSGGPSPAGANGKTCQSDGDCASGHCVGPEKICCATTCSKEPEDGCGQTGACDAQTGTCAFYGPMTTCRAESCSTATGMYTSPAKCLGPHMCDPQPATSSCNGFSCDGTHCQMDCDPAAGKACAPGNYCGSDHKCALQKALGDACGDTLQCGSGFCVDGVCCDKACTDKCFSCSSALTQKENGHCLPTDPNADTMDCPAATPGSCKNTGHCDGAGACQLYGPSTTCGSVTCSGNSVMQQGTCNGKGSCSQPSMSCQFGCSGGACNACSSLSGKDCGSGCKPGTYSCQGVCQTHGVTGPSCPGPCNNSCQNGSCASHCPGGQTCGKNGCGVKSGGACSPSAPCLDGLVCESCLCADGTTHCEVGVPFQVCGAATPCSCIKATGSGVCL